METIEQYLLSISMELGIEVDNNTKLDKHFIEQIKEKDLEWHKLISSTLSNTQSYFFVKKDKELRIKAKDIWEAQKEYFKKTLISDLENINTKLKQSNISNISLAPDFTDNL